MSGWRLIPNEPIRQDEARALVCREGGRSSMQSVPFDVYSDEVAQRAEQLRTLRIRADLGLREAAKELRLRPRDLSAIESGALSLDYDDCGDLEGHECVVGRVERAYQLAAAVRRATKGAA